MASLGGVLGRLIGLGLFAFDLTEWPWTHCEMATIKILIGYAYVGITPRVRDAISGLPLRQQCGLLDLVTYLEGPRRLWSTIRPWYNMRALCVSQIQASVSRLPA